MKPRNRKVTPLFIYRDDGLELLVNMASYELRNRRPSIAMGVENALKRMLRALDLGYMIPKSPTRKDGFQLTPISSENHNPTESTIYQREYPAPEQRYQVLPEPYTGRHRKVFML
ncbi:hypothetical protein HZB02_04580 [Candidatus Woesearchaeota archaeon]|nr:hypothetical protein [Candidatus Woesearchaeota archaeon]